MRTNRQVCLSSCATPFRRTTDPSRAVFHTRRSTRVLIPCSRDRSLGGHGAARKIARYPLTHGRLKGPRRKKTRAIEITRPARPAVRSGEVPHPRDRQRALLRRRHPQRRRRSPDQRIQRHEGHVLQALRLEGPAHHRVHRLPSPPRRRMAGRPRRRPRRPVASCVRSRMRSPAITAPASAAARSSTRPPSSRTPRIPCAAPSRSTASGTSTCSSSCCAAWATRCPAKPPTT